MARDKVQTSLEQLAQLMEEHKDSAAVEIPVPQKLIERLWEEFSETTEHEQIARRQLIQYEKMATLGQRMAGIAHEISTPIASINSNVDLLTRSVNRIKVILSSDSIPEELREKRQIIQVVSILDKLNSSNKTACERVVQIVQGLRKFARVDMTELREIDIHEELEDALTLVHHELKKRIKVVREYGEIPKCTCFPNQLNGVFVNILMNAAQAIEGEGQISIETLRDRDTVKVKFADTGRGIPPENLERLFEAGFTTKSPEEGTGLGLAICKRIIEEHHGEIEVESEVGGGTTFTITLPLKHKTSASKSQNNS